MVAIAMTREMGTLGKDVAQGIADLLGLKVIHSELVEHDLARRLGSRTAPSIAISKAARLYWNDGKSTRRSCLGTRPKKS